MVAGDLVFTEDELAIDEALGYPKAYAKLCRDRSIGPYSHGPPLAFIPFALPQQEVEKAQELDELFPIIDLKAKPTTKPKIFLSLLWRQLNHLGNAGFDPEIFRVDPYGNVLYYHADAASPLAWEIDHWFPLSRGGLTVASNLRILQWQVCKKKHNKLELLIPWWDLQVGVSINQFLSIFASSNSDFRRRAFSWLFTEGESEELNACQTVDSHSFPQHFIESKQKVGLAPAAIVLSRRESMEASSALRSLDVNRKPRSTTPIIAAKKIKPASKENEDPGMISSNPYQAIVIARDSLRKREETAKIQAELQKLDVEVDELRQKADEDNVTIQDLELVLIKRRRRAEKCRRLAEAQSSYRAMLEKMIRDAMHQSVVYKEQVRLNQAAANALMARLEAQKAICDTSERELHKKFKQRDELEKQVRPEWKQARKRSRMDDSLPDAAENKIVLYLPESKSENSMEIRNALLENTALYVRGLQSNGPLHKELRKFLEEEQKASQAGSSSSKEKREQEELGEETKETVLRTSMEKYRESSNHISIAADQKSIDEKLNNLDIGEDGMIGNIRFPDHDVPEDEEDEESRKQRGKGNVEKWLQMLMENAEEDADSYHHDVDQNEGNKADEIIRKLDIVYPQKEFNISEAQQGQDLECVDETDSQQQIPVKSGGKSKKEIVEIETRSKSFSNIAEMQGDKKKGILELQSRETPIKNPPYRLKPEKSNAYQIRSGNKGADNHDNNVVNERKEKNGKEKELVRSESARTFRRIPSSPSLIFSGMKKRVDCIGKKPLVIGDDADVDQNHMGENNIIKSTIKTIKRAVKI